jgi:hypothetical protein
VSTSILCLAVAFSAPAAEAATPSVYRLSRPFESAVQTHPTDWNREGVIVRGQTPGYDEVPGSAGGAPIQQGPPQTYVQPPNAVPDGPVIAPGPLTTPGADPFLNGPGAVPSGACTSGPQPYRLNRWINRYDVGWLPNSHASNGLGSLGIFETNAEWEYNTPVFINWIFGFTQQFNYRAWEGPQTSPALSAVALPGSVYRVGWDLKLATPANYQWSALLAFNPSINSDFEQSLSRNAWNLDGRGMIFFRQTPQWTWVLGAGYWDRVHDKVIPYAGVIYTPNPRWEWRILFPESRISYLLGQPYGFATWFYARGEYHSEAYEIMAPITGGREQVEITDWRILMGFRFDNGWVSSFIEAGWVFNRDVDYRYATPDFDVRSGFIGRIGLRF